jgi:hypothetical protein
MVLVARLAAAGGTTACHNQAISFEFDELCGELGKSIPFSLAKPILDGDILSLSVAEIAETVSKASS